MSELRGRIDESTRRVTVGFPIGGLVLGAGLTTLLAYASVIGFWNGSAPPTPADYVEHLSVLGAVGAGIGLVCGGVVALAFKAVRRVVAERVREDDHGAARP